MSTTVTSSTSLLTAAESAAKTAYTANAASAASSTSTSTSSDALSSLTSNYNEFLSLLTTQLQNQDPTSPMESDTFTSELAQFAGVEQQIQTNTNLTQLLSLNQDAEVSQSSALTGDKAVASTTELPLQNGSATIQLSPTTAETAEVAITDSTGTVVKTEQLSLSAGTTDWTWDGTSDSGTTEADGTYNVAVVTQDSAGTTSSVPFSVIGTVTGVSKDGTTGVNVEMGSTTIDMSNVTSLASSGTSSSTSSTATTSTTGS